MTSSAAAAGPPAPGHLFVVQGDLRALAVDAWVLPTDVSGTFGDAWLAPSDDLPALPGRIRSWRASDRWGPGGGRVRELPGGAAGEPRVVLGAVPDRGTADPAYHAETVRRVVDLLGWAKGGSRVEGGRRRRLALPALGIGRSGGARVAGAVLSGLMPLLLRVAQETGVDLVLVLSDATAAAAARAVRRRPGADWWPALDLGQRAEVGRLAGLAVQGRLTLFTGAGTSMAAGLPSWQGLLVAVEGAVRALPGVDLPELSGLSLLDRATVLADTLERAGGKPSFEALVAAQVRGTRYSLQHGLLAGMPLRQAITLNYDRLLERAAAAVQRPFTTLPYEPAGDRWLLKLHGDLDDAGTGRDVVLTRAHYLSATGHRATLTGLVQAVLTTQHLLFVGFGLQDDHVHALVHDVRRALGPRRDDRFGTALMVRDDPALARLWERDIEVLPLVDDVGGGGGGDGAGAPPGSWRLEVFLDALANAADPSHVHLLDPDWADALDDDDTALAAALTALAGVVGAQDGAAWTPLLTALRAYGWRGSSRP